MRVAIARHLTATLQLNKPMAIGIKDFHNRCVTKRLGRGVCAPRESSATTCPSSPRRTHNPSDAGVHPSVPTTDILLL